LALKGLTSSEQAAMGAGCSTDHADQEQEFLNSPTNRNGSALSAFGFCGTNRGTRLESSEVIDDDGLPAANVPHAASALALPRRKLRRGEEDSDEENSHLEEATRWAPPVDDLEDKIDERQWQGMMSAMDQFLPFDDGQEERTNTPSSSSHPTGSTQDSYCKDESFFSMAQREAAFEALRQGRPLCSLAEELRGDKDVVLAAIEQEGPYCYDYITNPELKKRDRDVVLALVRTDGSLLENCSEELRADKQIVRCALSTCSEALKLAPAALQCDRELKAVAASRAKEEQRLLKMFAAEMCGPNVTAACIPKK